MTEENTQEGSQEEILIPTNNTEEYFTWLQDYHSPDRILSLDPSTERPEEYDYRGITSEQADRAMKAILEQRKEDPKNRNFLLKNLSPAQIIHLASSPNSRLYTPEEESRLYDNRYEEEISRFSQFPNIHNVIEVPEGTSKFIHATPEISDDLYHTGLFCTETGLDGVAVPLSREDNQGNLLLIAKRHKEYQKIITIVLPDIEEESLKERIKKLKESSNLRYLKSDVLLSHELPEEMTGGSGIVYRYAIPPKFIQGVFDTKTGEFVSNTLFDPQISEEDLERIKKRLEELESRI